MAKRVKNTWYVSYRPRVPPLRGDYHRRMAETFPTEADAKNFARSKLAEADDVVALLAG